MKAKILSWMNVSLTRKELEDVLKDTYLGVSHRNPDGSLSIVDEVSGAYWLVKKEKNYGVPGIIRYNIDPAFESFLSRFFKKDLRA